VLEGFGGLFVLFSNIWVLGSTVLSGLLCHGTSTIILAENRGKLLEVQFIVSRNIVFVKNDFEILILLNRMVNIVNNE